VAAPLQVTITDKSAVDPAELFWGFTDPVVIENDFLHGLLLEKYGLMS
jgi:hypothetical protein